MKIAISFLINFRDIEAISLSEYEDLSCYCILKKSYCSMNIIFITKVVFGEKTNHELKEEFDKLRIKNY